MKGQRRFKVYKSLLFNLSFAFAILILAISMTISTIGYYRFTDAITLQYEEAAFNAGATVQALIEADLKNGGDIDKYIEDNRGIKQKKDNLFQSVALHQNMPHYYLDWNYYVTRKMYQ